MIFKPHAYQQHCLDRLLNDPAIGLFLDMGLGKTVIALTAINELKYNRFAICKTLVIAPKKVAESTWSKEAAKWDHLNKLRISLVLGSEVKRLRALNTPADIYIINRENVQWLVEHYRNAWPFDTVVVDEFSSFKNHKAKRFIALTWVRCHIERIIGLTGTPAPNGLIDLWAQVYLLDQGERLGKKITHFRERFFAQERWNTGMVCGYNIKPGADEAIQDLIGDICISMSAADYLELPDCVSTVIPVVLDSKAKAAYRKLEREMLLEIDDRTIDAGSAAVLTNKLLQLCNGAVYDAERNVVEVHDCKIEVFMETVEALNGQPALVFYNFQHDLTRINKAFAKLNLVRKTQNKLGLRIRELRETVDMDDWNAREIDILLAHPASAAYGLNLQEGGNHIIWFGLNWSLELYQQANKRIHRQGQKEKVFVHHLIVEGGVDEDVMAALEDKGATQDKLMIALKARIEKVKQEVQKE